MSFFTLFVMPFAVLAYAMVGGVFLAFSDFIMRALSRTAGTGGLEAMQVINREVFRWVFMVLFLGMAALSAAIGLYGALVLGGRPGALMALAGGVYVAGCFGVTALCNVPMNRALAAMPPSDAAARDYWAGTYLPRWTFWNTVRTAACVAASVLLLSGVLAALQAQAA